MHKKHIDAFKEDLSLQVGVLDIIALVIGGDAHHVLHHVLYGEVLRESRAMNRTRTDIVHTFRGYATTRHYTGVHAHKVYCQHSGCQSRPCINP